MRAVHRWRRIRVRGSWRAVAATAAGTVTLAAISAAGGALGAAAAAAKVTTPAPEISSIDPSYGPAEGGTTVSIDGSHFSRASLVLFGTGRADNARASFRVVSDTRIVAVSPRGSGVVDVTVVTPGGASAATPADQFSYAPVVASVSPNFGPPRGGTEVTITGSNFTGVRSVDFGGIVGGPAKPTRFHVVDDQHIVATSPSGHGTVDVILTGPGGSSPATPADDFSYAPLVRSISPSYGPTAGGTEVHIAGGNLTDVTSVQFGNSRATFRVDDDGLITATSPPGRGIVDVVLRGSGGWSLVTPADRFSYGPVVTSVEPSSGPRRGGTTVTISGGNFTNATSVIFARAVSVSSGKVRISGNPATFHVDSDTQITATSPSGQGLVDIIVTSRDGDSATSSADEFTYVVPPPAVGLLIPSSGPEAGGTSVTIAGQDLTDATAVRFGETDAVRFTIDSDRQITATAPPGTGTVDVRVTTPSGTSQVTTGDQYAYLPPPPMVEAVGPSSGPTAGGTAVTIIGSGFTDVTAVQFGTAAATSYHVDSDTQITATAPPGTGTVDVTVTNTGGTSAIVAADQFTYQVTAATISTVAGNGDTTYNGDGGAATTASINGPSAAVPDAHGNLYIADSFNDRIRRVDAGTGIITTVAGMGEQGFSGDGGPATQARFSIRNSWGSVAVDGEDNLYIADYENNRVRRVDGSTGIVTTVAGNGSMAESGDNGPALAAALDHPQAVAVDRSGTVYVAESSSVRKFVPGGDITRVAGNGEFAFSGDGGPAVDAAVCAPTGLAVDATGQVYIADANNERIRKVDVHGIITTVAGTGNAGYAGDGGAATNADLNLPLGVAVDDAGNLYIADANNSVVRKVDPSGSISTFAGTGSRGFSGDGGPATDAQLNKPEGVSVDGGGAVYIADSWNNRIRMVR